MSNISAGRKFNDMNAEKVDKLKAELATTKDRAKVAEQQNAALDEQLAEAEGERGELRTRMAAVQKDSTVLEEAGRRLEFFVERLEAEKTVLRDQVESLKEQLQESQKANLALQDERGRVELQLAVSRAEKDGAVSLSSADKDRMLADQARLEASAASHLEYQRSQESLLDATKKGRDELQRVLAVAEADAQWKDERIARAISEREDIRNQKDALQQQVTAMDIAKARMEKEMTRERETVSNERIKVEASLAAMTTERDQLGERSTQAEAHVSRLLGEISVLQSRANAAEERHANEVAARSTKADEAAHSAELLAISQAESRGKDHLLGKLEQQVDELFSEIKVLLARAEAAETRTQALQNASDIANAERTAAAEQLAATTADRLHQEREDVRRDMEKQLGERKTEFAERAAFAELRCKELSTLRDESQASVTVLYEQMVASREERSELQQALALCKSEKVSEGERADRAEGRIATANEQRENALVERNRMAGEMKLLEGEKKASDEANARLEARVAELQAEQVRLEVKAGAAVEKAEDMVRLRDDLIVAKQASDASILSLHAQKGELQQQLVEANVSERTAGLRVSAMELTIDALNEDKRVITRRAEAAQLQQLEMLKQRDIAIAESSVIKEQMAILRDTYKHSLERVKELDAAIETLRESKAKSEGNIMALEATLRSSESSCEATVQAAHARSLKATEECRSQVEECIRLKETAAAAAAELKGKEELIQKLEEQLDAKAERARSSEQLNQERTERSMLEDMVRKAEHRLEEYKTELAARAEFAESRVVQLSELRDESETNVTSLKAQLMVLEQSKAQLQHNLATKTAEKHAADEMRQIAEVKAAETLSERDAMLAERNRASEATKAALAEKAAVLAVSSQLEWQVTSLRAEHGKMEEFLKESSQIQVAMARANTQVKNESNLAASVGRLRTGVYCGGTGYGTDSGLASRTTPTRRLSSASGSALSPEMSSVRKHGF